MSELLSICIPTHNRYPFLKWTFEKTCRDFVQAQICISDNASTDDTKSFATRPIRYVRQESNIGAFPNMRAVLLMAQTKYCIYLGDDDYLLPDEVQKGIDFLEENPWAYYYCAPCQLWNEVEQTSVFDAFFVTDDRSYYQTETGDREALWNFIIANHVWPEHVIYRREGLEQILTKRNTRAYWAFEECGRAFRNQNQVHFVSKPFYRNIVQHPVGNRAKLGDRQCLTNFDEYRGGLEILAYDLFADSLTPELKINIQNMITRFITSRLMVAETLLRRQNITDEADSYRKRAILGMLGRHD